MQQFRYFCRNLELCELSDNFAVVVVRELSEYLVNSPEKAVNCQNITTLFFHKKTIAFFLIMPYTINRGEAMPTKFYEVFI